MPSEHNSGIDVDNSIKNEEAIPKPPTLKQNILLSLKLVVGGGILILLMWYLDHSLIK